MRDHVFDIRLAHTRLKSTNVIHKHKRELSGVICRATVFECEHVIFENAQRSRQLTANRVYGREFFRSCVCASRPGLSCSGARGGGGVVGVKSYRSHANSEFYPVRVTQL